MKTIREILLNRSSAVYNVRPDQSVFSIAQFMRSNNVGAVPVTRGTKILGIVSERDILKKVVSLGLDPREVFAHEIMSRELITVSPDETWEEGLFKMRNAHCRHLPVVEKGELIAIISLRDLLGQDDADLDNYLWDRYERQGKFNFKQPELNECC
jgi:CBS domain-containing protein